MGENVHGLARFARESVVIDADRALSPTRGLAALMQRLAAALSRFCYGVSVEGQCDYCGQPVATDRAMHEDCAEEHFLQYHW